MTPPYALMRGYYGGSEQVNASDDLDGLLRERDEAEANGLPRRTVYFVIDADDAERGNAEWCESCGKYGAFGGECEICE